MRKYIEVDEYKEPVESARSLCSLQSEMSDSQLAFLCGLIREKSPHKIVEVGVASGGTTLVILECLKMLELKSSLFSVDLNECLYSNMDMETGYVAKNIEKDGRYAVIDHKYLVGKYLPEVLSIIGRDIDFLILDTVHAMPGELLDFLAALPLMKVGTTVVLHDVALQHVVEDNYCYATQVLFSCVTAEKYINITDGYPNIAAFCIGEDTNENVNDLFSVLTITWGYRLSPKEISIYRSWYSKYYNEQSCSLLEMALRMNEKTLSKKDMGFVDYMRTLCDSVLTKYKKVYLYGAGKRGKMFHEALEDFTDTAERIRFVISSRRSLQNNCVIWDSIKHEKDILIILTADSFALREKLRESGVHWIDVPSQIWKKIEWVYGN